MNWMQEILFVVACLVIPVIWGWMVDRLFARFNGRKRRRDETGYIDYYI